jgi:hypothetical protein
VQFLSFLAFFASAASAFHLLILSKLEQQPILYSLTLIHPPYLEYHASLTPAQSLIHLSKTDTRMLVSAGEQDKGAVTISFQET